MRAYKWSTADRPRAGFGTNGLLSSFGSRPIVTINDPFRPVFFSFLLTRLCPSSESFQLLATGCLAPCLAPCSKHCEWMLLWAGVHAPHRLWKERNIAHLLETLSAPPSILIHLHPTVCPPVFSGIRTWQEMEPRRNKKRRTPLARWTPSPFAFRQSPFLLQFLAPVSSLQPGPSQAINQGG